VDKRLIYRPLPNSSPSPRSPVWSALGLAWELGYLIIIPLIVFGLGGRGLDQWLGTSPWLFLSGMVLAVVLTTIFLIRKFSQLLRQMEDSTKGKS